MTQTYDRERLDFKVILFAYFSVKLYLDGVLLALAVIII